MKIIFFSKRLWTNENIKFKAIDYWTEKSPQQNISCQKKSE